MKFYRLYLLSLLIIISACQQKKAYQPEGLTILTDEKLLDRARNHQFPSLEDVTFKNQDGTLLSMEELQTNYSEDDWAMDYYVDASETIREMVLRPATAADQELRTQLKNAIDEGPPLTVHQIDCNNMREILQNVFGSDQNMRNSGQGIDTNVDRLNLEIVVSLLDQCGMPRLSEVGETSMAAIWLVFQHSTNNYRKKYFSHLKEAASNGDLKMANIAMLEDKILMADGKPQKYGTQISRDIATGKWELYKLEDAKQVHRWRKEVGLGDLQSYLDQWEIDFNEYSSH